MSSLARPVRTYSRRQSTKNASSTAPSSPDFSGRIGTSSQLSDEDERPKKRRLVYSNDSGANGASLDEIPKEPRETSKPSSRQSNRSADVPTAPSSPTRGRSPSTDRIRTEKGKKKAINGSSLGFAILRDTSPSASESPSSHPTTPKKPKDLSRIFDSVSPQRRHSPGDCSQISPGKSRITKMMLSRSRTESSIETSPSKELTPKSRSFILPAKDLMVHESVSPTTSPRKPLSRNPSQNVLATGSQQPQTNTRTYAGNSRSFLVALPASSLLTRNGEPGMKQDTLDEDDEEYLRDSYTELRKRYGVDNSEGVDGDSGDAVSTGEGLALYNPLSSITDLRSKGESRRFRDEVGYLFEGLEPLGALSVRRSSALDIVSKLSAQEFWQKARAAGLIMEIWDRLREAGAGDGDKVLDPILCCFLALASEDSRDISLLADKEDWVETVIRILVTYAANDPLSSTVPGNRLILSKAEALMLDRLRDLMSAKPDIVHEECQPSTRLLLSCALTSVPTLASPHLSVLLDSVSGDIASVCSRLAAYKSGLALFHDETHSKTCYEKLCFDHIYNCLSILDLYLIEVEALGSTPSLSKTELRQRYRNLPSGLVALIVVADVIVQSKLPEALLSQANRCSELSFRILINLTNGSPTWTDAVVADPYTLPTTIRLVMTSHRSILSSSAKKLAAGVLPEDASASAMDRLCLALALLTNLLQERDNLAYSLQNIMLDPSCPGQRACLLSCRCANSVSAVSGLVNVYISFLKQGDDDLAPDFHFLRGHLSVLIGLLLLQLHNPHLPSSSSSSSFAPSSRPSSPSSQASTVHSILDALPGSPESSGRRQKLDVLIDNVDAFSHLYASLTNRVSGDGNVSVNGTGGTGTPGIDGETSANLNDDNRSSETLLNRNGCDSDVVANVASSLRALRAELCRS